MRVPWHWPTTASTCAPNCGPATWRPNCRANWPLHPHSLLVLGTSNADALQWDWLARLLEGPPQRAVLIVNAARAESLAVEA